MDASGKARSEAGVRSEELQRSRKAREAAAGGLAGWARRLGEDPSGQRAICDSAGNRRNGEARTAERATRLRSGSARQREAERNETGCGRWRGHLRGKNHRAHRCGKYRGAGLRSGLKFGAAENEVVCALRMRKAIRAV